MNEGFWADRGGRLFPVTRTHISFIMDNPELFGWDSLEKLKDIYRRHGEKFGWEGKARREIMVRAMQSGWVRIRQNGNTGWTVEYVAGAISRRYLRRAVESLVDKGYAHYDESIRVIPYTIHGDTEQHGRPEEYMMDQDTKEGGVAQFLAASISYADLNSELVQSAVDRDFLAKDKFMSGTRIVLERLGYSISSIMGHADPYGRPVVDIVTSDEGTYKTVTHRGRRKLGNLFKEGKRCRT